MFWPFYGSLAQNCDVMIPYVFFSLITVLLVLLTVVITSPTGIGAISIECRKQASIAMVLIGPKKLPPLSQPIKTKPIATWSFAFNFPALQTVFMLD